MPEKLTSEGKCLFCNKTFKKAGIVRHLNTHLAEKSRVAQPNQISFHLKVEANPRWGTSPWFLNLWVDGNTRLKDIDLFLRNIWLECCGHLSAFRAAGLHSEVNMTKRLKDILTGSAQLEYEYDFGSTTELLLSVVGMFPIAADEGIVLLSRNEPLAILCALCGKQSASSLCSVCMYDGEAEFCEQCATKHAAECRDYEDYAAMPIVNSPRMGVCGYDGGRIDKERDGIYSIKS